MYLKITNLNECHNGLQYQDGLIIDPIPFEKEGSCCPGGIYFTTPEYICNFMNMGRYVREELKKYLLTLNPEPIALYPFNLGLNKI